MLEVEKTNVFGDAGRVLHHLSARDQIYLQTGNKKRRSAPGCSSSRLWKHGCVV